MEITFEEEFPGAENRRLPEQQRRHFYEKMRRVAVIVHIVFLKNIKDGNRFQPLKHADMGSGFMTSKDGHIMTCLHVVDFKEIRIFISHAEEPDEHSEATIVHEERGSDVAVLKLKEVKHEFDYCKFGSIEDVIIGMEAFSISNPHWYEFSFLKGQVSSPCVAYGDQWKEVKEQLKTYDDDLPLVQLHNVHTKAGSSGGPIFNGKGRVIAMSSFGVAPVNYAIHIRRLREVIAKVSPILPLSDASRR